MYLCIYIYNIFIYHKFYKCTNSPYWKGVLNSGKTGLFNPANTVTYLGSLPSSTNRDSFCRSSDRSSKRKLRTEMISRPQNDLKHTGHVGLDGAYFGDIAFMSSVQNVSYFSSIYFVGLSVRCYSNLSAICVF